jgi:SOS-response transcriptional repressor LexA
LQADKGTYKLLVMTTLAERMKLARAHAKITQKKLAEIAGVEQPAISQMESGKTLKSAHLVPIAKACGVSVEWLASGTGGMTEETSGFDANVEMALQPTRSFMYPEISWVQAGSAREAVEMVNVSLCPQHSSDVWAGEDAFWLRVSGNSMTSNSGNSFPEGFLILVAPDIEARQGQFVVARMIDSNEATFKQLVRDAGELYLKPLNPSYPTKPVDDTWEIVGTVVDGKMPKSVFMM